MSLAVGPTAARRADVVGGTAPRAARRSTREERRARAAAAVTLLAVMLAALTVGLRDLGLLDRSAPTHRIGDDVSSSFGVVAVEFVRSVDGVTSRALAGASHGVSGLVDASHQQMQVAVAITNRSQRPIHHTAMRFTLLVTAGGTTRTMKPAAGDLPDMRIQPHAGIEGHLDFTLPRKRVHLTLLYRDPGAKKPIVIDLGSYASRPAAAEHGH
jgi:anti-sigma factor RsiW